MHHVCSWMGSWDKNNILIWISHHQSQGPVPPIISGSGMTTLQASHGVPKLKAHLYYFGIHGKGQQDVQHMSSFSLKT